MPWRSMNNLDRVGRFLLGRWTSFILVTSIVRIGALHAVDHGSQNWDSGDVQRPSGSLDLREPADVESCGKDCAIGASAHDERVGDGEDRG